LLNSSDFNQHLKRAKNTVDDCQEVDDKENFSANFSPEKTPSKIVYVDLKESSKDYSKVFIQGEKEK